MSCVSSISQGATRVLAPDELLFEAGETKAHLYRVESGAICLYDPHWNGNKAHVDFFYPGDIVGFGFLESHILSARVLVETRVSLLPLSMMLEIITGDSRQEANLAEAIDREFDARREHLNDTGYANPIERVAALLVNLSCSNRYEGRDPTLVTDSLDCGTIAEMLDISVDDLAEFLVDLQERNLIAPDKMGGLRLTNVDALETLADGIEKPATGTEFLKRSRPPRLPEGWREAG